MPGKYDFHYEIPEYYDRICELEAKDRHFAHLLEAYREVNREVQRIEEGKEFQKDDYLENLKKKRLLFKDKLYGKIMSGLFGGHQKK